MLNKKGVSLAVAWVLLLGLSISLAIFVGTWLKNVSQETGGGIIDNAIRDQRCADTVLIVNNSCAGSDLNDVIGRNTGVFNITKVKCRNAIIGVVDDDFGGEPLAPGQTKVLNNCDGSTNFDIIPIIEIDNQDIACAEKGMRISC